MLTVGSMRGLRVLKHASALLAGAAMLPVLAWAQSNGTAPQIIPGGGFSLPPKPTPTPAPPPSGPIIAPLARPTPAPAPAPTPAPTPAATVAPPPVTTTSPRALPSGVPTARTPAQPTAVPTNAATPQSGTTPTPTPSTGPVAAAPSPGATSPVAAPTPAAGQRASGSSSTWVALGVALVALAGAGWFLLRRRRRRDEDVEEEPVVIAPVQPAAAPPPPPPPPAPPSGHLTIPSRRAAALSEERGKPELEIVLIPRRAGTNLLSAAVDYRIQVRNVGQGTARDVRFGIYMLSASARQAADLQMIFAATIEQPVVAPFELPPGGEIELSGMAMLPRERVNVMNSDGKAWFVPVLAMKAEYRWGENVGAPGVATAAHMIGIDRGEGAKMAPFRLEGAHMHPEVAERRVA